MCLGALTACGGGDPEPGFTTQAVPASAQRAGDAAAGYADLLNRPYISCGVPYSVFSKVFGTAEPDELVPGREGKNAQLPYYLTAFRARSGVELVTTNCLVCHAGRVNGRLVLGLGDADSDFTRDVSGAAALVGGLIKDPAERAEWQRWYDHTTAIAPFTQAATRGVNPADNLTAALIAHRDQRTLAWSQDPLLEPPPERVVPVDVPPWWRMAKKNAMFYNASGRGDHARIMMTASTLCTDTVDEAREIDRYFPNIYAYLRGLKAPAYPFPVDAALAARGGEVYAASCAGCHGTGAAYPNLLVSLPEVGTDPVLASASQFAGRFVSWYNGSFYGEVSRIEPQLGYVAPPLDGIWATAPYLHNGSVPTLEALLESGGRPRYWTRSYDSRDYDQATLGWRYTALAAGQADVQDAAARSRIYDTTLEGYGNGGHRYGDGLSAEQRRALLEYLKTL